jgi:uncharacterized protein (DUF2141 family)
MKSKIILITTLLFLLSLESVLSQNKNCSLSIKINNIKSNKGEIALRLTSSIEDVTIGRIASIHDNACIIKIDSLSSGIYRLSYFHDENSNDKLDTNWMGIPIEGYGFSNNAKSNFGSPSIEEREFEIKENLEIKLIPKY